MAPLKRHYLLIFPLVILFSGIGIVVGIKSLLVSFFSLGLIWSWVIITPELREKVRSAKYRFSFFRFMFWMEKIVEDQVFLASDQVIKILSRVCGAIIFSAILSLLGGFEILLANLLGVLAGEAWLYVNKRFYPELYLKREPKLSENSL